MGMTPEVQKHKSWSQTLSWGISSGVRFLDYPQLLDLPPNSNARMFNKKTNETVSEKPSEIQVEDAMTENHKLEDGGDYSGAVAKTDPKAIALVKKLDIRIMGILWAMYFLVNFYKNSSPKPTSDFSRTTSTVTPSPKHD